MVDAADFDPQIPARSSHSSVAAHAAAQEAHFIKRARERFRLKITPKHYRYLVRKVVEVLPGTRFLCRCGEPNRTQWRIRAGGMFLRVIYDETTDRLVTCVPYGNAPEATMPRHEVLRMKRRERSPNRDWLHKKRRLARL